MTLIALDLARLISKEPDLRNYLGGKRTAISSFFVIGAIFEAFLFIGIGAGYLRGREFTKGAYRA